MTIERFNELVEKHGAKLYRLAYRLTGNMHTAEDMVQDTFKSVWKTKKEIFKEYEFAFLVKIIKRRIVDMRRLKKFSETNLENVDGVVEFNYIDNEYSDAVQKALARLDTSMRETLLLVVVGELTHVEVSELLKIPVGTVLSRVNRTRKQLRNLLKEKCII